MSRTDSVILWSLVGVLFGSLFGAVAGCIVGVFRAESVIHAALAGLPPGWIIGGLGGFFGGLLADRSEARNSTTILAVFFAALLGAVWGALIGAALGADNWLLASIANVEHEGITSMLHILIALLGGPQVLVGALLGLLTIAIVDTFFDEFAYRALICAALLTPVVAIAGALGGQVDWGAVLAIVAVTAALGYIELRYGIDQPRNKISSAGVGAASRDRKSVV